ncbi:MAG: dipeptidyl-peptidase 4, partial [Nocardioidaceae bacterium]|nr:dipeptidyl-peptidase 4 [Nocardioidaceae bacterium]
MVVESFPRLSARTLNFSLGLPRELVVSPDGQRVAFLRSASGTTRELGLWVCDVSSGTERRRCDPVELLAESGEALTGEERARRERARVVTAGITAFSTDEAVTTAAFALSSRLFVVDLVGDAPVRELGTHVPVVDPRLDPTGRRVAFAGDRGVHVVDLAGGASRLLVGPDPGEPDEVSWGLAEFVAAEELGRSHGFWWAPDGESLLVERCDETPVSVWYISDPAHPELPPRATRYPQCGTANALVSLAVVPVDGGAPVPVEWRSDVERDGMVFEYLAHVAWNAAHPVITVLTRDQRTMQYRDLDPATGRTTVREEVSDDAWVELLPGTPVVMPDGRLVTSADVADTRRLYVDGVAFTPPEVLVDEVLAVGADAATAAVIPGLGARAVARLGFDGTVELLSDPTGYADGSASIGGVVVSQRTLNGPEVVTTVLLGDGRGKVIAAHAERPPFIGHGHTFRAGDSGMPTTVLFPTGHVPGSRRLPVLMDPYGGPHGRRVVNSAHAYLTSQWFADQGFVVIVCDGRGTAGNGPAWDRRALHDRVGTADDQAVAVRAVAERFPDDLDTSRVGIRGWSFGGYLAALAVLRHPDVFGAAIAGAPTSDERLYDTCYSERNLGDPKVNADVYDRNSLIPLAPGLTRPLMIIHGLADDNVYPAHALALSGALL